MPRVARRLGPLDTARLAALLDEDVVHNAYLRSEIRLGGTRTGTWFAVEDGDRLTACVLAGSVVVPWIPDVADAPLLAAALDRVVPPRMMVGPAAHVVALHQAHRPPLPVREIRNPQPLMALRRGHLRATPSPFVRRGRLGDLDALTVAAAAMHREEMGVDPLTVDPAGWRARMAQLIERGWSWLWVEDGEIVFKTELSAWTPECAQLQGVWTAPRHRRRGLATSGLAAVCLDLFRDVEICSLYVNHYNEPALRLYERLGFEVVGTFATLLF